MYKIESSKPPKASIKSLIRRAISNRYDIKVTIAKDGSVSADFMKLSPVDEWYTTRTSAGSVRLYQRHTLMYTFSPEV